MSAMVDNRAEPLQNPVQLPAFSRDSCWEYLKKEDKDAGQLRPGICIQLPILATQTAGIEEKTMQRLKVGRESDFFAHPC